MDTPTPTPDLNEVPACSCRRTLTIAGLAGVVALAGLVIPALAGASNDDATDRRASMVATIEGHHGIGEVTLANLAGELDDLGLEITVSPAGRVGIDAHDTTDDWAEPADAPAVDDSDDPFAGMTGDEIDALSDDEFFAILDEAGWTVDDDGWIVPEGDDSYEGDFDESGADDDSYGDGFDETAATFSVDGDSLTRTSGDSGAVAEGEAIWKRFAQLIPADQRAMLVGFEVSEERGGGGYVYPDDQDPTTWILGISPGLGDDEDFVLIHEFAHLLTLQAKEVPPSEANDSCPTYHTGEGCALSGSTMAEFVSRFWPPAQRETVLAAQESGDWDAIDAFYEQHRDDFVTDYATTNPAEDLAETFTVFVLEGRPTGDTIADQKLQLLWSDPAMLALRDQIRAAL